MLYTSPRPIVQEDLTPHGFSPAIHIYLGTYTTHDFQVDNLPFNLSFPLSSFLFRLPIQLHLLKLKYAALVYFLFCPIPSHRIHPNPTSHNHNIEYLPIHLPISTLSNIRLQASTCIYIQTLTIGMFILHHIIPHTTTPYPIQHHSIPPPPSIIFPIASIPTHFSNAKR